jgi:hypothetical protein
MDQRIEQGTQTNRLDQDPDEILETLATYRQRIIDSGH